MQGEQWSLRVWNGPVASYGHDGSLTREQAKPQGDAPV
jgi:hypothetical protein